METDSLQMNLTIPKSITNLAEVMEAAAETVEAAQVLKQMIMLTQVKTRP